jgi:hypothetical protein
MPAFRAKVRAPMQRVLEPELLDSLAPDDPAAVRSRRDLLLTNRLMGNHRWLERRLPRLVRPGEQVLELGAGTGELGLRLGARGLAVDGIDRWPRPARWPLARRWQQADLRHFAGYGDYPVIVGNLIFHQFGEAELAELGARLRARLVVACEPVRRRLSQWLYRTLAPLFGADPVSLHDAQASIAAGFRANELPAALGLTPGRWDCRISTTCLGAYRMVAVRRG